MTVEPIPYQFGSFEAMSDFPMMSMLFPAEACLQWVDIVHCPLPVWRMVEWRPFSLPRRPEG